MYLCSASDLCEPSLGGSRCEGAEWTTHIWFNGEHEQVMFMSEKYMYVKTQMSHKLRCTGAYYENNVKYCEMQTAVMYIGTTVDTCKL